MAPSAVIAAPPAAPPRVSLLTAGARRIVDPDDRWTLGLAYDAVECVPDPVYHDRCATDEDAAAEARTAPPSFNPYVIEFNDRCSSFGFQQADYQARASRIAEAGTPWAVERELWTGAKADAAGWTENNFLANVDATPDPGQGTVITATPQPIFDGLAALQQAIADARVGRGMIHATVTTVSLWTEFGMGLRREGPYLLDAFDNFIVPGTGYDGSDPTGGAATPTDTWAYATSVIEYRLSGIDVYPKTLAEATDRRNNTVNFVANRFAAATWDGCVHAGIALNLATRT